MCAVWATATTRARSKSFIQIALQWQSAMDIHSFQLVKYSLWYWLSMVVTVLLHHSDFLGVKILKHNRLIINHRDSFRMKVLLSPLILLRSIYTKHLFDFRLGKRNSWHVHGVWLLIIILSLLLSHFCYIWLPCVGMRKHVAVEHLAIIRWNWYEMI